MSSLRTFIDLHQFYDFNQLEGIRIKSVAFKKQDYNHYQQNSDYFAIDCKQKLTKPKQLSPEKRNNSYDNQENIDIGNLSFSNELKTDEFLNNIMASKLLNLNFTCLDKNFTNDYMNMNTNVDIDNQDLHRARLVLIDAEPFYENNEIILQENERKLKQKLSNPEVNNNNNNNRDTKLNDKTCSRSESPFTKYLFQKTAKVNDQSNEYRNQIDTKCKCRILSESFSFKSNIDIIPSPNKIKTLSKFHKIHK